MKKNILAPHGVSPPPPQDKGIQKRRHMKLSLFQQKMAKKLNSAKFRMLNESLYSTTGAKAKAMMEEDPDLFNVYHSGYAEQVKRWPSNPLDDIIKFLATQKSKLRVADLGCGEARLSREASQRVMSFDLVAMNDSVTECDMANLPLSDSSVDIAVFCLSLMGVNYREYLKEAFRVVVPNGIVIVAEVTSRFPQQNPRTFIQGVEAIGFQQCPNHPLVTGLSHGDRHVSRKRTKSAKRRKPALPAQHRPSEETPFFLKFVFRSCKGTKEFESKPSQRENLPQLAVCMYKKR